MSYADSRPLLPPGVSLHFGVVAAQRLISAASRGDIPAIDRITEELARAGVVRKPSDTSKFGQSSQSGN